MVEISADTANTVKTRSIEEVFEDKMKEDFIQTDESPPSLQIVNVWHTQALH